MQKLVGGFLLAGLAMSAGACRPPRPETVAVGTMPVVFRTSFEENPQEFQAVDARTRAVFESGKDRQAWQLEHWLATDAKAWRIVQKGGNSFLSLAKQSELKPEVTSPRNFILLPGVQVTSFALDLKMQSTSPRSRCRSLCVIFGYQGPKQFYYAHIANVVSTTSHAVLVVDGQDRMPITHERGAGVQWGDGWHHVRVVRRWGDGAILVYFDDMSAPLITAMDQRFDLGRIGIGSFDDLGNFDEITLRGVEAEKLPGIEADDVPRADHLRRAMEMVPKKPGVKKPR